MKVHVLESHFDYEGSTLHGVFGTAEKAKEYAEENWNLKKYTWINSADGYWLKADYETYSITEMEVQ